MAAILVARIRVTNPEKYEAYKPLAKLAIDKYGGRYLARGVDPVWIEGEPQNLRMVVVEFPSMDAVRNFYDSPEYKFAREARAGASIGEIAALETA